MKEEPIQPASPRLEKPTTSTQPAKKLGTIGSKKAAPAINLPSRDTAPTRGGEVTASEDDSDDLDSGPRLSQPGPLKRNESPPPSSSEQPSPVPKKPSIEPKVEEEELSAQQKADKKREELKRQMHATSKAPQKKKRKF